MRLVAAETQWSESLLSSHEPRIISIWASSEISNQKFPPDEAEGISRQIIKVLLESPGSCWALGRPMPGEMLTLRDQMISLV